MKIIEAMNELKLTEKKLQSKLNFVAKYAARPSFRDDVFKDKKSTEAEEVKGMVQGAIDLITQHENMKRAIDRTNLATKVDVKGKKYTIHSLILHKRFLGKLKAAVWGSLNPKAAEMEIAQLRSKGEGGAINAQVIHNFDIKERDEKLTEIMELMSEIDSTLQIANTKVDILEDK